MSHETLQLKQSTLAMVTLTEGEERGGIRLSPVHILEAEGIWTLSGSTAKVSEGRGLDTSVKELRNLGRKPGKMAPTCDPSS